jgi:hypothetical protein
MDHAKARKRIASLAQEILGERERMVFLSRCMSSTDEVAHLDSLAAQFGVSRERVYQLEASSKRKIANALTQEGYSEFARTGASLRLPPVRAPRRIAALPLRKTAPHAQIVARS